MMTTREQRTIQAINELIEHIENNDIFYLNRETDGKYFGNIFQDYTNFAKALFNGPDLKFIPLSITRQIGIKYFRITKSEFNKYLTFVFNHQDLFKELHEKLRELGLKSRRERKEWYQESIKRILLEEALIERRRPMNLNSLLKTIYNRIYQFLYLPDPQEIYAFYIRNLPGTVAQTNTRPMPRMTFGEEEHEEIKRLPWKSKFKANDYMKSNGWNDRQKEFAKGQLKADNFNIKKNKKLYQLHLVAPRHTFIIDLFFPGRFTYLLAVNVNTRKGFAIPSPLITKQGEHRFNVPNDGHKTTSNVIRMFDKLLQQTPVKMIVHDKESAFLSKEFAKYCRDHNITIKPYSTYNVSGLTETNDTTRPLHGLLSILDRLCRTLRNMAFNIGVPNQEIDPDIMEFLLKAYNSSPHSAFFNVLHMRISPDEMDSNNDLEDAFCYHLSKSNFVTMNENNFEINCPVRVFNQASLFDKLKHKLLPGIFRIVGKEGNLIICKQNDFIIKVPRWMIQEAEL